MSQIDFETDTLKHYVRRCGWLTAAKESETVRLVDGQKGFHCVISLSVQQKQLMSLC